MAGEPAPAPADTGPAYDALNIGSLSGQLGAEMQKGDQLEAERTKALEPMRNEMKATLEKQGSRPPPELKPGPQLSPQAIHKDANDFVDTAILLGAIGGLLSRAPLIGAMNAFSGAMSGFREGDDARVKSELETFNAQVKAVKEQNTELLDRYKLILDNDKLEVNAKLNLLEITANQYNDPIMASQARAKNLSTLIQLADRREVAAARMEASSAQLNLQYARLEQQREMAQQKADIARDLADHKKAIDDGKLDVANRMADLTERKVASLEETNGKRMEILARQATTAEERAAIQADLAKERERHDRATERYGEERNRIMGNRPAPGSGKAAPGAAAVAKDLRMIDDVMPRIDKIIGLVSQYPTAVGLKGRGNRLMGGIKSQLNPGSIDETQLAASKIESEVGALRGELTALLSQSGQYGKGKINDLTDRVEKALTMTAGPDQVLSSMKGLKTDLEGMRARRLADQQGKAPQAGAAPRTDVAPANTKIELNGVEHTADGKGGWDPPL